MPLLPETIILAPGQTTGDGVLAGRIEQRGRFLRYQQQRGTFEQATQPLEEAELLVAEATVGVITEKLRSSP